MYYYVTLLLIIDYCYLELCTTTSHYYLSLIIVTSSNVLLHYDNYFDTQTDCSKWATIAQRRCPASFATMNHLLHLAFPTTISQ